MIKIDMKDKRILYELDIDSRQSLSQIGKKVGLPKNVVAYRINKLRQHGIIKTFYTVVDAYKLGYIAFRMYLTYQYMTPEIEKELICCAIDCIRRPSHRDRPAQVLHAMVSFTAYGKLGPSFL